VLEGKQSTSLCKDFHVAKTPNFLAATGCGDWKGWWGCFTAEQILLFVFIHPRSKKRDAHSEGCSKDWRLWMATEDETTQRISLLTWWEILSRQEKESLEYFYYASSWYQVIDAGIITARSFKDWHCPLIVCKVSARTAQ